MTHIFNKSVNYGIFPTASKTALIAPLFKQCDFTRVDNYQSIAIISIFGRIFEELLNERFNNFLEKNNILSPNQFGFPKNMSTSDAMTRLVEMINNLIGKNLCIFMDLSTVRHG